MNLSNLFKGRKCLEHQGKKIILVCLNDNCITNKLTCDNCIAKHSNHATQLKGSDDLERIINGLSEDCNSKIEAYNAQINDLIISLSYIKRIAGRKFNILVHHLENEFDHFCAEKCQNHQKEILMICRSQKCQNNNKFVCYDCQINHNEHPIYYWINKCLKRQVRRLEKKLTKTFRIFRLSLTSFHQIQVKSKNSQRQIQNNSQRFSLIVQYSFKLKISVLITFIKKEEKEVDKQLQNFKQQ